MRPLFAAYVVEGREWPVTLVDTPHYHTSEEVADGILYNAHPRELERTDILVVRASVDQQLTDIEKTVASLKPFLDRAPYASLYLLYSKNFAICISLNLNPAVGDRVRVVGTEEQFLRWLRETELRSLVEQSSAVFRAGASYCFRAPSNTYVRSFLRVGNIQRGRQSIDSLFFWMLPYLKDRDAILTDTWSISSTALNAARLLEGYTSHERHCRVDMLPAYFDSSPDLVPGTLEALTRLGMGRSRILILMSAVRTGRSYVRLREFLKRYDPHMSRFDFLSLYKLERDVEIASLCDLSKTTDAGDFCSFESVNSTELRGRSVISIDRHSYFPMDIGDTPILIKKWGANPGYKLFSTYRGLGAFAAHRDAVDLNAQRLRHHAIDIDIEVLLDNRGFRNKYQKAIGSLDVCPAVLIVPPHRAGLKMVEVARTVFRERFGSDVAYIVHPDLRPDALDGEKAGRITSLGADDLALVLDDVTITGRRLSRYQVHLRELE